VYVAHLTIASFTAATTGTVVLASNLSALLGLTADETCGAWTACNLDLFFNRAQSVHAPVVAGRTYRVGIGSLVPVPENVSYELSLEYE
jgi:hypothetical protein